MNNKEIHTCIIHFASDYSPASLQMVTNLIKFAEENGWTIVEEGTTQKAWFATLLSVKGCERAKAMFGIDLRERFKRSAKL